MKHDPTTDKLIKQAQKGDLNAFETLIIEHEKIVFNIAFRMLPNPEDAKDISQEVFIKLYKNLYKFDWKSAFSTWLYRITVNTCIDELRKRKGKETESINETLDLEESNVNKQFESVEPTPEQKMIEKESAQEILSAMNQLSDEHKIILTLRDLQNLTYNEIMSVTGLSMGTVKSRLARARIQLKNILLSKQEHFDSNNRQNNKKGGKIL